MSEGKNHNRKLCKKANEVQILTGPADHDVSAVFIAGELEMPYPEETDSADQSPSLHEAGHLSL